MLLTYNQLTEVKFHCSWAFKRDLQHLLYNTWCVFGIKRHHLTSLFHYKCFAGALYEHSNQ